MTPLEGVFFRNIPHPIFRDMTPAKGEFFRNMTHFSESWPHPFEAELGCASLLGNKEVVLAYREHGMWEVLDVLKRHHRGESQRRIAVATGRGRKTIRAYIREAKKLGWSKEVPPDDELASRVAQRRQPGPSSSEASASEKALRAHHDRIQQWVEGPEGERGLKLTKVHELLTREGVDVSYSSVYRYAVEQFGLARSRLTLRRAEVSPGELAEVDFGQLGKIYDPESDRKRLVWALLVTLGFSRHRYVHVNFSQKLSRIGGSGQIAYKRWY